MKNENAGYWFVEESSEEKQHLLTSVLADW
jgi:hypothetical protein